MNLNFPTSTETITALKFNLSEASVLATTGTDRTFTLYDVRTGKAERRLVFQVRICLIGGKIAHLTHLAAW
jgi:WD repeat and SOF domain-containing protein 1